MTTSLLAWQTGRNRHYMLMAGLVLLGSAGIMVDGRRMMLDIPVAAFSALAVLFMLMWFRTVDVIYAVLSSIAMALGFLIKGPVALMFTGAGFIAMLIAYPSARRQLRSRWLTVLVAAIIFCLLALPWFFWLYTKYPEQFLQTLGEEVSARNPANISLDPLFSIFIMALPWSPALIALLVRRDVPVSWETARPGHKRFLIWWLVLSIIPFFFFKSFGRYLYGCMVPLALLVACLTFRTDSMFQYKSWFRAGAVISLLVGVLFIVGVIWFRGFDLIMLIPVLLTMVFSVVWWRSDRLPTMAAVVILYWCSIIAIVYPRLGINAIPDGVIDLVKGENVVLFAGPQPALLPVVAGRGMQVTNHLHTLPENILDSCRGFLLFSPHRHFISAHIQLKKMDFLITPMRRYRILSSRGSWLRIAHEDATLDDWLDAIRHHDLDELGTDIILIRATKRSCRKI
jgi:4-amino-4-deoxy-L-arabinose transferase-like glycosyltransferase